MGFGEGLRDIGVWGKHFWYMTYRLHICIFWYFLTAQELSIGLIYGLNLGSVYPSVFCKSNRWGRVQTSPFVPRAATLPLSEWTIPKLHDTFHSQEWQWEGFFAFVFRYIALSTGLLEKWWVKFRATLGQMYIRGFLKKMGESGWSSRSAGHPLVSRIEPLLGS